MARPPSTQPTDGELEILNVLWDSGPVDLGVVRTALQAKRSVATTTVATMLKLMREKGLVERDDGPRGYMWSARVSRQAARAGLLGKLLNAAFEGSARGLVAHLLEAGKLSAQDREAIRRMLEAHDQKAGDRNQESRA
jgi:BlaI family transcriptional regulator, penicillinase repressor